MYYDEILREREKHNTLTPLPLLWLNDAFGKKVSTPTGEKLAEIATTTDSKDITNE